MKQRVSERPAGERPATGVGGHAYHALWVAMLSALAGPANADTNIVPNGDTDTSVDENGNSSTVTTGTISGDNAFNAFSRFEVAQGDEANLQLPDGTARLINLVHDSRAVIDGTLNALKNGEIGGDVIFADPHGFLVGASGTLNVGSLGVATPTSGFMDGVIGPDGPKPGAVADLLAGNFDTTSASIEINGTINAERGTRLLAGEVTVGGSIDIAKPGTDSEAEDLFNQAVNTDGLQGGGSIEATAGDIVIAAEDGARIDGELAAGAPDTGGSGGTVVVTAGGAAEVTGAATIDVTGAGTDGDGGRVAVRAADGVSVDSGSRVEAGTGAGGDGGRVEIEAGGRVRIDGLAAALGGDDSGDAGTLAVSGDEVVTGAGGTYTDGGHVEITADANVTVEAGGVVNSRDIDDTTHVDDPASADDAGEASTGGAGDISITAPTITVAGDQPDGTAGASLLAFTDGDHDAGSITLDAATHDATASVGVAAGALLDARAAESGAAGDIELVAEARDNQLAGAADAEASVVIGGELLGGDIDTRAYAESSVVFDNIQDVEDSIQENFDDLGDLGNIAVVGTKVGASVTIAYADADVTVADSARLDASGDIDLSTASDRRVDTSHPSDPTGFTAPVGPAAVSFGQLEGSTSVTVAEGATITAGDGTDDHVRIEARATDALKVAAASEVQRPKKKQGQSKRPLGVGGALAVAYTRTDTRVNVAGDVEAGGDVDIAARHDADYNTAATYTIVGKSAAAGVTGAVASLNDETAATVSGTVDAGGDMTLTADSVVSANRVWSQTRTGSTNLDYALASRKNASSYLKSLTQSKTSDTDNQKKGSASTDVRFGAAVSLNLSDFDARAEIADGGEVDAGGDVAVQSRVRDAGVRNVAISKVNSAARNDDGTRLSLSTAVTFGRYEHASEALVGNGATIEAARVGVGARTEMPITTSGIYDWANADWEDAEDVLARLKEAKKAAGSSNLGMADNLLTSYSNATGTAEELALAGAVNYFGVDQTSTAEVGESAHVQADTASADGWTSSFDADTDWQWDGDIDIDARTTTEALNFVGNLSMLSASGTGAEDGTAVGGALGWTDFATTTRARVGDDAWLQAPEVTIDAASADQLVNVGPSAGRGSSVAVNGVLLLSRLDNRTRAALSNAARVDAADDGLAVNADQDLSVWTLAGAANMSSDSGIGAALGFNWIDTDTDASIGAVEIDADDDSGDASLCGTDLPRECGVYASSLALGGRTGGRVGGLGVAGALTRSQNRSSNNGSKSNLKDNSSSAGSNTGGQTPSQQQTSGWESLQNAGGSVNSYIDLLTAKETTDGNEQAPSQDTLKKRFNDKFRGNDGKLSGEAGGENSDNSGGQSKPEFGLTASGSAAANVALLDTSAYAEDATLEIGGPVDVEARRHTGLFAGGGAAAVRAGGGSTGSRSVAVAGALGMNVLDNNTRAYMDGTALDVTDGSDVSVRALSGGVSGAVGLGLAVNTQKNSLASAAGSASVTVGLNDTAAYLEDTTVDASGGDLAVTAYDHVNIASGGGGLYAGGKAGLGAAISFTLLDNETRAHVDGGLVTGITDASVQARSPARILAGAAMGGYANSEQKVGLAGSFVVNLIDNTTAAEVSGDQGDPVIEADGDVSIQASGADDESLEDALGLGAIDAPFDFAGEAIPDLEYTLGNTDAAKDKLSDASGVNDDAMPTIAAPTTGQDAGAAIISVAGMAQAGQADVALGLAGLFNGVSSDYTAAVDAATIRADGQIDVDATNNTRITSLAAGLSAQKGQFVGTGSFAANVIDGATTARVTDSHITGRAGSGSATGGLAINASDSREIWSAAGSVAVSQGGTSAGGALGVNLAMGSVDAELTGTSVRAAGVDVDATSKTGLATGAVAAGATSGSIAVTGSLDLNLDFGRTRARVEGSDLTLVDDGPLDVTALDDSVIWGLAGGVSLAKGPGAVGVSGAVNVTAHEIDAALLDTGLDAGGSAVGVDAARGGSIVGGAVGAAAGGSVAGGVAVSANVVADQVRARTIGLHGVADGTPATAASLGVDAGHEATILSLGGQAAIGKTAGVGGGVTANWSDATVAATLEDADLAVPGATDVMAGTEGFIGSFAFGFGAGKTAALGAALTFNGLRNDVEAAIVNSGQSSVDNTVTVRATDAATIWSGAVAGAGAKGVAGGLAVGGNYIGSNVEAGIHGPGDGSTGTPWLASDILVDADAGGEINTAAIGASASGGLAASGSLVANVMEGETLATIDSGADVRALGDVGVLARATQEARTFAGAGAFSLGFGAVGISAATNVLNDTTAARIDGDATRVTALGLDTGNTLTVPTGETVNSAAMASALETDDTDGDDENERFEKQQAALRDSLTDFSFDPETEAMRGVSVNAVSLQKTQTAGVAVAASLDPTSIVKLIGGAIGSVGTGGTSMPAAYLSSGAGAAANVGVNVFGGETRATIDGARINQDGVDGETTAAADQQVDVTAASHGVVGNLSAALSGGSVAAAAGAFAVNVSERETAAMIRDSRVDAAGAVTVDALGSEAFGSLAGGISGALLGLGPVGTSVANVIDTTTTAGVTGGTITAGQLDIHADHRALVSTAAGSVGLGTIAGAAGAVTVNLAESTTRAWLGDDPTTSGSAESTDLYVPGSVDVAADSGSEFTNFVASVAAGGALGGAGATAVNQIADVTAASAGNVDFRERASAFSVGADGDHGITTLVGAAGAAAGVGAGAAVGVNLLRTSTTAAVIDSSVDAGTFSVTADSHRTIDNVAAGFAGGSFGLAGGVGVTVVGDSDPGSGDGERSEAWGGTASARESADTNLDMVEDNSGADVASTGPGSDGVSASVSGGSVSAGSVSVEAVSTTDIERNKSGAAAGGLTGVGAGVAVAQVSGNITARFEPGTATVGGDIVVNAQGRGDQEAEAYAGSAGASAIGAAIADSRVANTVTAEAGGSLNLDGTLSVAAEETTTVDVDSLGAQAGASTQGVSMANAVKTSDVTAGVLADTDVGGADAVAAERVDVRGELSGSVIADATASAVGAISGNGAVALAEDGGGVTAEVGANAALTADEVRLRATANPYVQADAIGVTLATTGAVGASVAEAGSLTDVTARVGDGASIDAGRLEVTARREHGSGSGTAGPGCPGDVDAGACAFALGATGGALVGVNATVTTARSDGEVTARVGDAILPAGEVDIAAESVTGQYTEATGYSAGIVAAGANEASAENGVTTRALLADGASQHGPGSDYGVRALSDNTANGHAVAGSGGVVSGVASGVDTTDTAVTRAAFGGGTAANPLIAGDVTVAADHQSFYRGGVDTIQASVVGASGARATHGIATDVDAAIGDGTHLVASSVDITAATAVRNPRVEGYDLTSGSGGVLDAAAVRAESLIAPRTDVRFGTGVRIDVAGDWRDEGHDLIAAATNDVDVDQRIKLDSGGAIAVARGESFIDVDGAKAGVDTADAHLDTVGDLILAARTEADLDARANVKTYGGAGAAQGESRTTARTTNRIAVGGGADFKAWGQMKLLAGRDAIGEEGLFDLTARTDLWNKTAFPVETDPVADAIADQTNTVSIADGAELRGVRDVTLAADDGRRLLTGSGTGKDLYRKAGEDVLNGIGEIVGNDEISLDIKYANSVDDSADSVTVNGTVRAGIHAQQTLTIDESLEATEQSPGITFDVEVRNLASDIQDRIDELYDMLSDYDGVATARKSFEAEIRLLERRLTELGGSADDDAGAPRDVQVQFVEVDPILARPGSIAVTGDNLAGNGELRAPGDAGIDINLNGPAFLDVTGLEIPADEGGAVTFNRTRVSGNSDINDLNTGATAAFTHVETAANSPDPLIEVSATFNQDLQDVPDGVVCNDCAPLDPSIFVTGGIRNLRGTVDIEATTGNVRVTSNLRAHTVDIAAGSSLTLSYIDSLHHAGGDPRVGGGGGTSIAGNNVLMAARYLNINGTIQSGVADWSLNLDEHDRQRIADADGDIKLRDRDPEAGTPAVIYDASEDRIELEGVEVSGGYMELSGKIMNTGRGDLWDLDLRNAFNSHITSIGKAIEEDRRIALDSVSYGGQTAYLMWDGASERFELDGATVENTSGFNGRESFRTGSGRINVDTNGFKFHADNATDDAGIDPIGQLRILDGYGRIDITNDTGYDLHANALDAGNDIEGTLRINDTDTTGDGGVDTTVYKRLGSDVEVYRERADGSLERVRTHADSRSAVYEPEDDLKFAWLTGTDYRRMRTIRRYNDTAIGFISSGEGTVDFDKVDDLGSDPLTDAEYVTTDRVNEGTVDIEYDKPEKKWGKTISTRNWSECVTSSPGVCWEWRYWSEEVMVRGETEINRQAVAADNPIGIEFIGQEQADISVTNGDAALTLGGAVSAPEGNVDLDAGHIERTGANSEIRAAEIDLGASRGIEAVRVDAADALRAATDGGPVEISANGTLPVERAVTGNGAVNLEAGSGITRVAGGTAVAGTDVTLVAGAGSVGSSGNHVTIDSGVGGEGTVNVDAAGDAYITETAGDLRAERIVARGGDLDVRVDDGAIVDANTEQTRDERAREDLLAVWGEMALRTQDGADEAVDAQVEAFERRQERIHDLYWEEVRNLGTDGNGDYVADDFDPDTFEYELPADERQDLIADGIGDDAIAAMEAEREDAILRMHDKVLGEPSDASAFDPDFEYTATQADRDTFAQGSVWTTEQLENSISAGLAKGTTDTTTRIEEENFVAGGRIDLVAERIGAETADAVVIDVSGDDVSLTDDQRVALASAEPDDLDITDTTITVEQREDVDLDAGGAVTATADSDVFIGGQTEVNVEEVSGGAVRIKTAGDVLTAAPGEVVIDGHRVILESGSGTLGTAADPVRVDVDDRLTARGSNGVHVTQDATLTLQRIVSDAEVGLTVTNGDLLPGPDQGIDVVAGGPVELDIAGDVGGSTEPLDIDGGVIALDVGGDAWLAGRQAQGGRVDMELGAATVGGALDLADVRALDLAGAVEAGSVTAAAGTLGTSVADGGSVTAAGGITITGASLDMADGAGLLADWIDVDVTTDIIFDAIHARGGNTATDLRLVAGDDIHGVNADARLTNDSGLTRLQAGGAIGGAGDAVDVRVDRLHADALGGDLRLRSDNAIAFSDRSGARDAGAVATTRITAAAVTGADLIGDTLTVDASGLAGPRLEARSGQMDLQVDGLADVDTLIGGADVAVEAGALAFDQVTVDGELSATTLARAGRAGHQRLGSVETDGRMTLTADGEVEGADLRSTGSAIDIDAAGAALTRARAATRLDVATGGFQDHRDLHADGSMTLTAGGPLEWAIATGDAAFTATADGAIAGGAHTDSAVTDGGTTFAGDITVDGGGDADLNDAVISTGGDIDFAVADMLTAERLLAETGAIAIDDTTAAYLGDANAGDTLEVVTRGDQGHGALQADRAMTLEAGGELDYTRLGGDSTLDIDVTDIATGDEAVFAGTITATGSGDYDLGRIESTGADIVASGVGGAFDGTTLRTPNGRMAITAASSAIADGESGETIDIVTTGAQDHGRLQATDSMRFEAGVDHDGVEDSWSGGLATGADFEAFDLASLGQDIHIDAGYAAVEFAAAEADDAEIRIHTVGDQYHGQIDPDTDGHLRADGLVELTAGGTITFRGIIAGRDGDDPASGGDAVIESINGSIIGNRIDASRDIKLSALNGGLDLERLDYGGTYSLEAGRDIIAGIGGDFDSRDGELKAGRHVAITTHGRAGEDGDILLGGAEAEDGYLVLDAAGDIRVSEANAGGAVTSGGLEAGTFMELAAGGVIEVENGVEAGTTIDATAGGGDLAVGRYLRSGGQQTLHADAALTAPEITSGAGVAATAGSMDLGTVTAATDVGLDAVRDIVVFSVDSGGDQAINAGTTLDFERLDAEGRIDSHSVGNTTGDRVTAGQPVHMVAGLDGNDVERASDLRLDRLEAPVATLLAGNELAVETAYLRERGDLEARSGTLDIVHTGDAALLLDATGPGDRGADRFDLDIDAPAPGGVGIDTLYAESADIDTNALEVEIPDAWITRRLELDTKQASLLADNLNPSTRGYDFQLHELDQRFHARVDGRSLYTTAYTVYFGTGYGVDVPNFLASHETKNPEIGGQSAVRNSLRRSVPEGVPQTRDTEMLDAGGLVLEPAATDFPVNLDMAELSRRLRAAEREENRGYEL